MDDNELVSRIFDKFDHFEDKLDKTCGNIAEVKQEVALLKQQVKGHLDERMRAEESRGKKFYMIMALMALGFSAYEIGRSILG